MESVSGGKADGGDARNSGWVFLVMVERLNLTCGMRVGLELLGVNEKHVCRFAGVGSLTDVRSF